MNKLIIIGNLTRDPVSNTTPSGINVCNFFGGGQPWAR